MKQLYCFHRSCSIGVLAIVVLVLLSKVALGQTDEASQRSLYEDEERFNQLSGAARTLFHLRFGKKEESTQAHPGSVLRSAPTSPNAPLSVLPNNLVNDAAADATAQDTQSETALVLGSGSNVVCGFNDSGSFIGGASKFTGAARSTNAGTTWGDLGTLPTNPSGDAGDPVLARDNTSGRIYLSTLAFSGSGLRVFRSDDDFVTVLPPVEGFPGFGGADFIDKPWMAVDNFAGSSLGNVYIVARNFPGGGIGSQPAGIYIFRSTDGGASFAPAGATLAASLIESPGASNVQGACVVVGPDHSVYAFWFHAPTTPDEIRVRRSTDQGATFGAAATVTQLTGTASNGDLGLAFRSNSFPQAAVNPVNGNIYVVYNDPATPSGGDRGNIFFQQSTNNGATWTSAVQLNTDGTTRAQFFPSIAVKPDGTGIAVCWYDRRSDPSDALIARWGVTGSISGSTVSFGSNFPISNQFPPVFGVDPPLVGNYMGDYDQMAADNSFFYTTWGDNRDQSIGGFPSRKNANIRVAKFGMDGPGLAPILDFSSVAMSGGNGNGVVDPDECSTLSISIRNNGTASASGISATLTTSTPGVTVTQPTSAYADIAAGGVGTNSALFEILTSPSFVCGTPVVLTLSASYAGGSDALALTLQFCCIGMSIGGSILATDPVQIGRLFRSGVPSTCASPKACPGLGATTGGRAFDAYTLTNTSASTVCVTAGLTSACGIDIFCAAYLGAFSPTLPCSNYLADMGGSGSPVSMSFNVPGGATVILVVHAVAAGGTCPSYTLTVTGITCTAPGTCTPVPIQLASFTGSAVDGNTVLLEWSTLSELNNYGFEVEKAADRSTVYQTIPGSFVPGNGTTLVPQSYSYTDRIHGAGSVMYRLKQVDLDGTIHYSDPIEVGILTDVKENSIPTEFSLEQNYPNPFNPTTTITYGLSASADVNLEVFNTLGQRVAVLVSGREEAGYHQAQFQSSDLASGVYIYRLHAGQFVASKRLLLLK